MRKPMQLVALLVPVSLTLLAGELVVRKIDGYPLLALRLPDFVQPAAQSRSFNSDDFTKAQQWANQMKLPAGIDPAWFAINPTFQKRSRGPKDQQIEERFKAGGRLLEATYVWNRNFVGTPKFCVERAPLIRQAREIYTFKPYGRTPHPRYRFLPSAVDPAGLNTNSFGWRGPEPTFPKQPGIVQVAFLGASTTAGVHGYPWSYPEHVQAWLNQWADTKGLALTFETINAGRSGINSNDIAAVGMYEVAPLHPDLVVYYEGSNQFFPNWHLPWSPADPPQRPRLTAARKTLERHSAIARRLSMAVTRASHQDGTEPPKPPQEVAWPADLDEQKPGLAYPDLPLNLPVILKDLKELQAVLSPMGSKLVLSSFFWLVRDGMKLDIQRHQSIFTYLNERFWPFSYKTMRRFADFQNRVFRRFAAENQMAFIDTAARIPFEPDFFFDAIHFTREGVRVQAWSAFVELVPVIEAALQEGVIPVAAPSGLTRHPFLDSAPELIPTDVVRRRCGL